VSGSKATNSDDLLIRRAQRGEPGALDDLIRQNYRLIHRWALVKTGDADDAEDVTQRVLIQLFKKLGTFRGRSSFNSWLYRITSNAAGELHRRRGARERAVAKWEEKQGEESAEPAVLGRIAGSEAAEVARAFFSELPERQREVFAPFSPRSVTSPLQRPERVGSGLPRGDVRWTGKGHAAPNDNWRGCGLSPSYFSIFTIGSVTKPSFDECVVL